MTEGNVLPPTEPRGPFIRGGGAVDSCKASLRMVGEDLDPEEITRLLGCQPSHAYKKGERLRPGHKVRAKKGGWFLRTAKDDTPLAEKIEQLMRQTTSDYMVWSMLSMQYQADVFCGLFLKDLNRGFGLPAAIMVELAVRGLSINFDIYYIG